MTTDAFLSAMLTDDTRTENGMPTHSTSATSNVPNGAKVVDLFYKMGGARKMDQRVVESLFAEAYGDDALLATKAAFYHRDIRGGQGERASFRTIFGWLARYDVQTAIVNIPNVPFYGRYDDLFAALGTPAEEAAMDYFASKIWQGDALAAKWAPRITNAKDMAKRAQVSALRKALNREIGKSGAMGLAKYRKLVAGKAVTVEQVMSRREWAAINYSHVPSLAIKRYRKAFAKRDTERYAAWAAALTQAPEERAPEFKDVKVNASAIYPYDIVRALIGRGENQVERPDTATLQALEAQWKALPNWMAGSESQRLLPVIDVSGSMFDSGSPRAVDVSVSLGLYIAERNVGAFKDAFISFSKAPTLHVLTAPTLRDRIAQVLPTVGYNTDLEAVFRQILMHAQRHQVPASEMPTGIVMISDMQFDACVSRNDDDALAMIDRMYQDAGYTRPNVIFWNVRTSSGVPVKVDQRGTALVSGFSPSIMKAVLACEDMTPKAVVLKTLNGARYEAVVLGDRLAAADRLMERRTD